MFKCIECSKAFSRRDSLLRHKKRWTHLSKRKGAIPIIQNDNKLDDDDMSSKNLNIYNDYSTAEDLSSLYAIPNRIQHVQDIIKSKLHALSCNNTDTHMNESNGSDTLDSNDDNQKDTKQDVKDDERDKSLHPDSNVCTDATDFLSDLTDSNSCTSDCVNYPIENENVANKDHKGSKIFFLRNDPNKLVNRLRYLSSTKNGEEIFCILKELKQQDVIE